MPIPAIIGIICFVFSPDNRAFFAGDKHPFFGIFAKETVPRNYFLRKTLLAPFFFKFFPLLGKRVVAIFAAHICPHLFVEP